MTFYDGKVSKATVIAAEGARVGIVSCLTCDAALVLDPRDDLDVVALHLSTHNDAPQQPAESPSDAASPGHNDSTTSAS